MSHLVDPDEVRIEAEEAAVKRIWEIGEGLADSKVKVYSWDCLNFLKEVLTMYENETGGCFQLDKIY